MQSNPLLRCQKFDESDESEIDEDEEEEEEEENYDEDEEDRDGETELIVEDDKVDRKQERFALAERSINIPPDIGRAVKLRG